MIGGTNILAAALVISRIARKLTDTELSKKPP